MFHRCLLLVLLMLGLPHVAYADLAGPAQKIPAGGTLRGSFSEDHYFTNSKKPLHSEGHFLIAPGKGILWLIEKPLPLSFIVTPQGVTQTLGTFPVLYTPAAKVPLIARVTDLITASLAGDWSVLEKDFAVRRSAVQGGWSTSLTPLETTKGIPFKSLTIAGKDFVETARVLRKDEGLDKFTFSDETISAAPPTPAEIEIFKLTTTAKR